MSLKKILLGEHTIHGRWDDVENDQFMVYWHPNGKHCVVFMMRGYDYGGGISEYAEDIPSELVDNTIRKNHESAYLLKEAVRKLPGTWKSTWID